MPLTKVSVETELTGNFSLTSVELHYENQLESDPLECSYTLPMDKGSTLVSFEATLDDKVIKTQIKEKESAKEQYDDAIAGGRAAVLAQKSQKDQTISVKLGNLLPGQKATIKSTMINQLDIVGGHFCYSLPLAFFPQYKKHGSASNQGYEFTY